MASQNALNATTAAEPMSNGDLARLMLEIAELLEGQEANLFRVRAYRNAAETLQHLETPANEILDRDGLPGLICLPGIGRSLASAIEQLCHTGRLALLERLRGDAIAERVFTTVPGIGPELASRIHDTLGIETLGELEVAALDGSIDQVSGMGRRRAQAVRESLAGRFRKRPRLHEPAPHPVPPNAPSVSEILDIDAEYRRLAKAGKLVRIAPKRFNPDARAWLPIMHTEREHRHYTAMFSNTARAHELGATNDWVVIYRDDHDGDGQWTVITSRLGSLKGRRIVRGRESECRRYYDILGPAIDRARLLPFSDATGNV